MSRKTTLQQVAEAAGVSLSTVDRVLNQRGGVSPEREAKVLELAGKLNIDRMLFRGYLKTLRVAVMMQSPKNPFYQGVLDAFSELSPVMSEIKINTFMHYIDVEDIQATTRKIDRIAMTFDALIVICPDDPLLSDALRTISRRMPIVTLVTDLPDSGRIAYVGPDNRQTGRAAGELMGRFLGPAGGDIVVMLGLHRIRGHEEREMGFRSLLRERFPQCTISATIESGEEKSRAGQLVREALGHNPAIRGIYNVTAGNAAIANTLRNLRIEHQIVFVTHELTPERRRLLREGVLDAIIDQDPHVEVRRCMEILAAYFQRSDRPINRPDDFTPFHIYLRENCPAINESGD